METKKNIRILSLDGGGCRGLLSAVLLKEIETRTGKPISELFDFFIGSSTVAIMSLLINKHDNNIPTYTMTDIVEFYTGCSCKTIFKKKFFKMPLNAVRYPSSQIEGVLKGSLGDSKMKDSLNPVVVTTYDTVSRNSLFLNSEDTKYNNLGMWECARASSAAPTFFEPFSMGDICAVDGGVVANNPALFGYIEAKKLFPDSDVTVVSLGTGSSVSSLSKKDMDKFNLLTWASNIFDFTSDAQSDTVSYAMGKLHDVSDYYRFQVKLNTKDASIDDTSNANLNNLIRIARTAIITEWATELDRLIVSLT